MWRLTVLAKNQELIRTTMRIDYFSYLFFDVLDDNPFVFNNLRTASFHREYTYRFRRENADILVLYYSEDYGVYSPILYLVPLESDDEFMDIRLSWNDESLGGVYHIGQYKLNELPREERTFPVFDWIQLR